MVGDWNFDPSKASLEWTRWSRTGPVHQNRTVGIHRWSTKRVAGSADAVTTSSESGGRFIPSPKIPPPSDSDPMDRDRSQHPPPRLIRESVLPRGAGGAGNVGEATAALFPASGRPRIARCSAYLNLLLALLLLMRAISSIASISSRASVPVT